MSGKSGQNSEQNAASGHDSLPSAPRSVRTRAYDPDELARLEDERDHLLTSLDDLEAEYAAGDIDDLDYETLKADYTARAAAAIRALESQQVTLIEIQERPRSKGRMMATLGLVVVFVLIAGWLVMRSTGQRGDGPITGAVNTLRAELSTCQTASFQDPAGGIECYDRILERAPDHLEALTYQGWAMVRNDQPEEAQTRFDRVVELDPTFADVRVFRAVLAERNGDYTQAAEELGAFHRNNPSVVAQQVLESQGLEFGVFIGSLDDATLACWQSAATPELNQAFLDSLSTCLDDVVAADSTNVNALVSLGLSQIGPEHTDVPRAVELVDSALAADPDNANASLFRGLLAMMENDWDTAQAQSERLASLSWPTLSFLIGTPADLEAAVEQYQGDS